MSFDKRVGIYDVRAYRALIAERMIVAAAKATKAIVDSKIQVTWNGFKRSTVYVISDVARHLLELIAKGEADE